MKNILLFIVGFVFIWFLGSFVAFTFDYSTLEPIDRFLIVLFSIAGGTWTVLFRDLL